MSTTRERFLQTLDFEPADPPLRSSGGWPETYDLWRQQGWDGRPLPEIFGTDVLLRVDVSYGLAPEFAHQVLEADQQTFTVVNHEGILMRALKKHPESSMPLIQRRQVREQ